MNIQTNNTNTNYVATEDDIRGIAREYFSAVSAAGTGRTTYLRMLIATTQAELGAAPNRKANARSHKMSSEAIAEQLKALVTVHGRFYPIIQQEADTVVAEFPVKLRADEKNRLTNFARTALYAARLYVRSGKDLTALAPSKLSKSALAVEAGPVLLTPRRLKGRVERASKAFVTSLLELSEADPGAAIAELSQLIGIMEHQLSELAPPTKARQRSVHVAHTETQVLRHRANPS